MPLGGLTDEIDVKVFRSHIKIPMIFLVPAAFVVTMYASVYLYANSSWFLQRLTATLHAQLGGHFAVQKLIVEPNLTDVQLYGVRIETPGRKPVIEADRVEASLNPVVLLARRLQVDRGVVYGADVRMKFDEQGHLNLLQALGVGDAKDQPDDSEGGLAVEFADIQVVDGEYRLIRPEFEFHIPAVDIPKASVAIEPETLLINVDRLDVDRIDFRFRNELMGFDESAGDWTFGVDDVRVRHWRWANAGFGVEDVSFQTEGIDVDAHGRMAFPGPAGGGGEQAPTMVYDGQATLSVPYWTPLGQYFMDDTVHFEVPEFDISARGSLEQIDGAARFRASRLETAGLNFRDVRATVGLEDQHVDLSDVSARAYGGRLSVPRAYFNIFSVDYGAQGRVDGVNPAEFMKDLDVDLGFLDGQLSGGFAVIGAIPFFADQPSPTDPYQLVEFASRRVADVQMTDDWVLERRNRQLAPASRVVLEQGASTWVDMNRVVVPEARVRLGEDRFRVHDFRFDYEDMAFKRGADGRPVRVSAAIADVGPWAELYGLDGLAGPASLTLDAAGPLGSPTVHVDLKNRGAPIEFPGTDVGADQVHLRAGLDAGRLSIDQAVVSTAVGRASATGWIDVLAPPGSAGPDETIAIRGRQPAQLSVEADQVDLSAVAAMVGTGVAVDGRLSAGADMSGTLQAPTGSFWAEVDDAAVQGQAIESAVVSGDMADQSVAIDNLVVDAGQAGQLQASGRWGFDGRYDFELEGRQISLDDVAPLAELSAAVRPGGDGRISLHGKGSTANPSVGGDVQFRGLQLGGRELGDVALVVNTVDQTVYVEGAAMPLATLEVEIPLDGASPFYAKIGMERLDLAEAVDELNRSPIVSRAVASGKVEVFMDRDLSRYQVLADLSELEVDSLGRTITNRGPVVVGLNNGDVVQIKQATLGTGRRYISAKGAVVLDPMLVDVRLDGQLDLSMLNTIRRAAPDAFPGSLISSRGALDVDATVRGAPDGPQIVGRVGFRGAELSLRGLSEPLRISSGAIQFERDRIYVDDQTPINGSLLGGVFNLDGQALVGSAGLHDVKLQARGHNMKFRVPEAANLTFDADVNLKAPDLSRPSTWLVGGKLDVLDGKFYRNISLFEEEVTGRVLGAFDRRTERYQASIFEQLPLLEKVRFDLAVRARDSFEIQNQIDRLGLDLSLRVDLRLQDTLVEPYVTGDIELTAGTVSFQGEQFEMRSGTVRFTGEAANPWIDVTAGADIRNRCRQEQFNEDVQTDMTLSGNLDDDEEQYYHVTLNLTGYADKLDIQFDSQPYADQRDILSLLLTGCTVDQLTASSASGPTLEIALGPLLGRIEKEIQDAVKVSEFTIMPGVERTQVRIGDALTRRLSWDFQLDTGIAETAGGQRYRLEYKLSDRWAAELSERSETQDNDFLLDLKLKYRLPLN